MDESKRKILRKALIGVCKDMDAMFEMTGQPSDTTKIMKEKLEEDEDQVLQDIMKDPVVAGLIEEWIKKE